MTELLDPIVLETGCQWIGPDGPNAPNSWACFRHAFRLETVSPQLLGRIAADSKYWLWTNGQLVVREGQLKRGPTPRDTYCDELDLAPYLRQGENIIAILVWYFGRNGSSHRSSGQGALLFEASAGEVKLASDSSWRARLHPAFGPSENSNPALSEWPIVFDARRDLPGWTRPGFDDSAWPRAVALGTPPCAPWNRLFRRPIPFWDDSEILPFQNQAALALPFAGGGTLVGELCQNQQVLPYLKVKAQAGREIEIQVERHPFSSRYTTRAGEQEWEVPAWGNGHSVRYSIPEGVTVLDVGYRETSYPARACGTFSSSADWMNALWKKSVTTLRVCMRDSFMDCPDRERSPWPGDSANMTELCGIAFDRRADDLIRKSFAEFESWKTPGGLLWGAVPTGRWDDDFREFPAQSQAALAVGLRDFWMHSGDKPFLEAVYPAARDYILDHFSQNEKGLVLHRGPWNTAWDKGTQSWYDWGTEINASLLDQTWLALCLATLATLAQALDKTDDAAQCQARWGRLQTFLESWWDEAAGGYRAPNFAFAPDPRGNALAALAGLIPVSRHERVAALLLQRETNSIYMEKHVIDALFALGQPDFALQRIARRYGPTLASKCSTLPERFGEEGNHAWGVGPAATLVREVVGLRPLVAGWKQFLLQPADVPLVHCAAEVPTPSGDIAATVERTQKRWKIKVSAPDGTTGVLRLPARFGQWKTKLSHAADATELRIPPGNWSVEAFEI